ncbi:hypothetical protein GCM10010106_04370 [Thermopolyspora flexuosa]|nr:hypothetical protein GCM10010106_04370 [Thermopolyspora flexuosa]
MPWGGMPGGGPCGGIAAAKPPPGGGADGPGVRRGSPPGAANVYESVFPSVGPGPEIPPGCGPFQSGFGECGGG